MHLCTLRGWFCLILLVLLLPLSCRKTETETAYEAVKFIDVKQLKLQSSGPDPITLAYTYTPDSESRYRVHMVQVQNTSGKGVPEMKTSLTQDAEQHIKVSGADESGVTLQTQFENIQIAVEPDVGTLTKKLEEMMSTAVLTYKVDLRGKILEMSVEQPQDGQLQQFMSHIKSSLDQFQPILPEKPVKPGDTWENDKEIEVPLGTGGMITLTMKVVYTFKGTVAQYNDNKTPTSLIVSKLTIELGGTVNQMGTKAKLEGRGQGSGVLLFNHTQGYPEAYETHVKIGNTITTVSKSETRQLMQTIDNTYYVKRIGANSPK